MTCTWCTNEAVEGGLAPVGVSGLKFIAGCEQHKNKIEKLKYTPMKVDDVEIAMSREKKLNK